MAGIGFELRKLLQRESYFALVRAYAYAGLISSGPWVLSIVGLVVIGVLSVNIVVPNLLVTQFQVSVTYLIAGSLILTGVVQLAFTRWVSDQLFARKGEDIVPNFAGVLLVTNLVAGTLCGDAGVHRIPWRKRGVPGADGGGLRDHVRHLGGHHFHERAEVLQDHRGAVWRGLRHLGRCSRCCCANMGWKGCWAVTWWASS
jgi:hypothetical protein